MAKLDKIKSLLGTLAPSIATALGGPVAGLAVGALSKAVLGNAVDGQADPSKIEGAVLSASDPEVYAKIRKADQDFQALMDQHGIDLEKIAAADRDSARAREIQVKDKTPARLAYFIIAFTLVYITAATFLPTHLDAMMVGTVFGYLISENKEILGYYFGSSAGSDRKTELLASGTKEASGGKA